MFWVALFTFQPASPLHPCSRALLPCFLPPWPSHLHLSQTFFSLAFPCFRGKAVPLLSKMNFPISKYIYSCLLWDLYLAICLCLFHHFRAAFLSIPLLLTNLSVFSMSKTQILCQVIFLLKFLLKTIRPTTYYNLTNHFILMRNSEVNLSSSVLWCRSTDAHHGTGCV